MKWLLNILDWQVIIFGICYKSTTAISMPWTCFCAWYISPQFIFLHQHYLQSNLTLALSLHSCEFLFSILPCSQPRRQKTTIMSWSKSANTGNASAMAKSYRWAQLVDIDRSALISCTDCHCVHQNLKYTFIHLCNMLFLEVPYSSEKTMQGCSCDRRIAHIISLFSFSFVIQGSTNKHKEKP